MSITLNCWLEKINFVGVAANQEIVFCFGSAEQIKILLYNFYNFCDIDFFTLSSSYDIETLSLNTVKMLYPSYALLFIFSF